MITGKALSLYSSGGLTLSCYSDVLDIRLHFWGGKFSKLHNSNLTCKEPSISTDSHSMAAYIFLWWVLKFLYGWELHYLDQL